MKKFILSIVLLLVCAFDGYIHYKEQAQQLKLEWALEITALQRDILLIKVHNCRERLK